MSKKKIISKPLPDYKNPPVTEVVCGLVFNKIDAFRAPHLGLFWQKVREEFPTCQHAQPLGFPSEPSGLMSEWPLPRVWFIDEGKNKLIQLQGDRYFYNWRKMHRDEPYPRYIQIIEAFKTNLEKLKQFFAEEDLGSIVPTTCELTYINHIPRGEGWQTLAEINDIIPELSWRNKKGRFLPEPLHWGWETVFALPEDKGRLHVKLQHATRKMDKNPLFILEIAARGLGGDKSLDSIWEWYEVAHQWIVKGFADLTGIKIQRDIWERR